MLNQAIIFLISLLVPNSKPCLALRTNLELPVIQNCLSEIPSLEPKLKFANKFLKKPELTTTLNLIDATKPFYPYLDYILGTNKPTTYLVLLQNNYEMRANGGFFGSYAVATLNKAEPSVRFQDIYVPDGALAGHVDPPAPIQTAFKQGWFKLRDSDWEPDFPTASTAIRWFFEKGNEINPDLLITLNLTTIEKLIGVIGDLYIPEYDLTITPHNLYGLLQNQAEVGAFQGSTQKKDVISAAGKAVLKKLITLDKKSYLSLANIIIDNLNHENSLINSNNPAIQKLLEENNWAGKISLRNCGGNCLNDTTMLVETNLGANKANCCVERKTTHTITKGETDITHLINLNFKNNSPLENPDPPRFYGGNYISYLRFYIPEKAKNIRLTAQPTYPKTITQYPKPFDGISENKYDLKDNYGLREVGFFHLTAAGTSTSVQLSYDLPLDGNPEKYQLTLLKQHGMESSPQEMNIFGKNFSTNLNSDYTSESLSLL